MVEEARVVIDLKEGIIELQGPVDFVRYYLEMYQPAVKGMKITPQKVMADLEKPARSSRNKSTKRSKSTRSKRVSCTAAIRKDITAGFFDEPRSTGAIKTQLVEAGFTDSNIRNSLKRLTNAGALTASGKGRKLTYLKPQI